MGKLVLGSIAGVVVLLVVLSGCGGGDSEELTKAEFIRKGETICGKMQSERDEVIAKKLLQSGSHNSLAKREATLLETTELYEQTADQIDELAPPAGDEKKVEAIVAAMHEAVEIVKADPGTILVNSSVAFKKPDSLAEAYGLKECAV